MEMGNRQKAREAYLYSWNSKEDGLPKSDPVGDPANNHRFVEVVGRTRASHYFPADRPLQIKELV